MSLTYAHIISEFYASPWAILPEKLAVLQSLIALWATGEKTPAMEVAEIVAATPREKARTDGAIAVLPLMGVLAQRSNLLDDTSGATSIERFSSLFRQALADQEVGAIIIQVDSPGGSVYGIQEAADLIFRSREAASGKRIVAVADSLAASAAYWIASAADEISVTPGGEVGSIGVLTAHDDMSAMMERLGVTRTYISAGRYKVEGHPYAPLDDEARVAIQERVDDYYTAFVASVARGRGVTPAAVREGFGEGRVVGAALALQLGMADRVETLRQVVERIGGRRSASGDDDRRRRRARALAVSLPHPRGE